MALHPPARHDDLRGISLCAGVGGLDLGLHIAEPGYRAVCHVERNSFAAAALVARMADSSLAAAPVWDDLRSFDGRPWRGRVHIVSAGYPCQPFSLAGDRRGTDDPRHLWPEVARIVREVGPEWCFFENVPGHLSLGLDVVAGDLQAMGYRVAACVLSAAEVGGSHLRERLFILAHADLQERGLQLDRDVGFADGDGLEPAFPGLFPPLPGALAEWGDRIAHRPDLKPAVQRLGDGVASGLDRTAAAGNGVVPLAAARAWRMLKVHVLKG